MELDSSQRGYAVPVQQRKPASSDLTHLFFFCMNLAARSRLHLTLTLYFYCESFEKLPLFPFLLDSGGQVSAIVGPLTSPIRCHGKLCSSNVGIQ